MRINEVKYEKLKTPLKVNGNLKILTRDLWVAKDQVGPRVDVKNIPRVMNQSLRFLLRSVVL